MRTQYYFAALAVSKIRIIVLYLTLSFGCQAQQKISCSIATTRTYAYSTSAVEDRQAAPKVMFAPKAASVLDLERLAQVAHIFRGVYLCE